MSNRVYDILKWIALYLLPALGTLYFTLSGIWGFPYGEQIVGTITALDTFLGVILGISKASYNKRGEWCGKRYTSTWNSTFHDSENAIWIIYDLWFRWKGNIQKASWNIAKYNTTKYHIMSKGE